MRGESIYIGPGGEDAPLAPSARDFRREALAFLFEQAAARDPGAADLFAMHPDGAAIRAAARPGGDLSELLFAELAALEAERLGVDVDRNLQNREPFAYWLRRREMAHHAELVAVWGELPPLFVALARASAEQVQYGTAELGARMIAGALLAKPDLDVRTTLRPLASNVMRRVLELVADSQDAKDRAPIVPPHDAATADVWIATLDKLTSASSRGPKRAGDLLGRALLATLFRGLDESLRRRARELAVTVIVKKLSESEVIAIEPGSPVWAMGERLAEDVVFAMTGGGAP
jgi:hypothetical protein